MGDILDVLSRKFSSPAFIFLREVRDATGFYAGRSADAMAVGLYRSRGRVIWGFEKKTSRSDWLRELKNPDKSEDVAQFCDFWCLVVPDSSIVKVEEIPDPWGLFVVPGERIICAKKPEHLDPVPPTRIFLSALLKAIQDKWKAPALADLEAARLAGYAEGEKYGRTHLGDGTRENYERLKKAVADFEAASGVVIDQYGHMDTNKRIGEAVRSIIYGAYNPDATVANLDRLAGQVELIAERMRNSIQALTTELHPGGASSRPSWSGSGLGD